MEPTRSSSRVGDEAIAKMIRAIIIFSSIFTVFIMILGASSSGDGKESEHEHGTSHETVDLFLPRHVMPDHYRLNIATDLTNLNFSGQVEIDARVYEDTTSITLHSKDQELSRIKVTRGGFLISVASTSKNEEKEFLIIHLDGQLNKGDNIMIVIDFESPLSSTLAGFYKSEQEINGTKHWMASTHFEATDARRAFPCFDEPEMKATFAITLSAKNGYTILANGMEESRATHATDPSMVTVTFKPTVKMSTYLVCFVVGQFTYVEGTTTDNIRVRVYMQPGLESQGTYALDAARQSLPFFAAFTGVTYPMDKVDLIAIPDFAAGAMENWGLVTFRETALLVDPSASSAADQQRVLSVVTHELAHQWFGNLVTMRWWNDLTLNEGFATYFETLAAAHIHPEYDMWTQMYLYDVRSALMADAVASSRALALKNRYDVQTPNQINAMFDTITYSKGGSILRMMRAFMDGSGNGGGASTDSNASVNAQEVSPFRYGIQEYVKKYAYSTANVTEFLQTMGVLDEFSNWYFTSGFPLVEVSQSASHPVSPKSCYDQALVQQRSISLTGASPNGTRGVSWFVPTAMRGVAPLSSTYTCQALSKPASIADAANYVVPAYLVPDETSGSMFVPKAQSRKANFNADSFYRVKYSDNDFAAIESVLRADANSFTTIDRASLLDDAFFLSEVSIKNVSQFLYLADAFIRDEEELIVWEVFVRRVNHLHDLIRNDTATSTKLATYMSSVIAPSLQRLGLNASGTHTERLLRPVLASTALRYGETNTTTELREMYTAYKNDPEGNPIPADIRLQVYMAAVEFGTEVEYNEILELYKNTSFAAEKRKLMRALASPRNQTLIERTLSLVLDTNVIKQQDATILLTYVSWNPQGLAPAWEFIKSQWTELVKRYGNSNFALTDIVEIPGQFTTESRHNEVKGFFDVNMVDGIKVTVENTLERITSNIAYAQYNREAADAWLSLHA